MSEHWSQGFPEQDAPNEWKSLRHVQLCTVHGILQTRILEWVDFPFSRGSSQPRDRTQVSAIAGRIFTSWATREAKMPKGEGLMGRREICNCPWRFHQGQRETMRERDMEEGKEGEKEGRRKKGCPDTEKCSGFSPSCLPFSWLVKKPVNKGAWEM